MTAKKCTKKRDARATLLLCQSKPIAFLQLSLLWPLSSSLVSWSRNFATMVMRRHNSLLNTLTITKFALAHLCNVSCLFPVPFLTATLGACMFPLVGRIFSAPWSPTLAWQDKNGCLADLRRLGTVAGFSLLALVFFLCHAPVAWFPALRYIWGRLLDLAPVGYYLSNRQLRYHDGEWCENVTQKVTPRSLKLQRDYPNLVACQMLVNTPIELNF